MIYLLLLLSLVLGVVKSSVYNQYAKSEKPDVGGIFRFNAVSYGTAAVVALLCGVGKTLSPVTVACAFGYAVVVFSLQAMSVAAMTIGPMSLTSLFVLYGMIIPSLAGPIFWHEPFGPLQAAGIVVMLLSIWMLREKSDGVSVNKRWAWMAAVCFVLSGMAGVMEKIHQTSEAKAERLMFLFAACTMMFLFSVVGCLLVKKRSAKRSLRPALLLGGVSGAIVGFYSQINLTLAGELNSLIYYPVANGGALLLTVFISVAVFREKLSGRRLAGFLLGLLSIVLLSLPAA
ncbi:MAG: hypothetical protein IKU17_09195 [Clostridia bacterium]|nr:hypothetical protein [Clostridia bacterium]